MTEPFSRSTGPYFVSMLGAILMVQASAPALAPSSPTFAARPSAASGTSGLNMGPRFSAAMRGEPLQRLLKLLENTTPTRFRYGAPVDTLVSETFDNAPLWPSIEALLLKSGFHMQRSDESVFLFRNQSVGPASTPTPTPRGGPKGTATAIPSKLLPMTATIAPASWQYWSLASPPPANWMEVQPPPRQPVLVQGANISYGWRNVALSLAASKSPGVAVTLPALASTHYLRWPMKLRDIPLGAQLLVETSAPASFYVNGAPMFRNRSGRQFLDLSHVLRVGDNCLALRWEPPAAPGVSGSKSSSEEPAAPDKKEAVDSKVPSPLLRYEWFYSERVH